MSHYYYICSVHMLSKTNMSQVPELLLSSNAGVHNPVKVQIIH